ncbi:MAG TPA: hypothetical protein VK835_04530 [Bacteroidia bacterium]|jgi:hypothetical protein|nr:hypothetical protein [Bacteroidia bacterium]
MRFNVSLLVWLICLCGLSVFGQTKTQKIVVDAKTKLPIEGVYVTSDNGVLALISNKNGELLIVSDAKTKWFSFYKIGYVKQNIALADLAKMDSVFLVENPVNLAEVVVTSKALETLIADKRMYVNDYVILPNNDFIILSSKINTKGFEIAYYKVDKGIRFKKKFVNEKNEFLFQDCFKNIHLVTDNFSRQLFFTSDSSFDFLAKCSKQKFDSTIALCVLKTDTQLVLKWVAPTVTKKMPFFNIKMNSPFLDYKLATKYGTKKLYTVFYNQQIKDMMGTEVEDVRRFQLELLWTMLKKDTHHKSEEEVEAEMAFFYSNVAGPIYAPVFLKNDTLVVFNFQEKQILFFNQQANLLKQVDMNKKDFSTYKDVLVIYDDVTKNFYLKTTEFDAQSLHLIDVNQGILLKKIQLAKTFAKNIQVYNNRIYYLFKEKDWDDTSYLYQQTF